MNFFQELKSRSVYKVAVAYAVVAWLLIQIATQVFPFLQIPDWAIRLVIVLLALGFPIALVLAWAFELTPEGLKRSDAAVTTRAGARSHAWIYIAVIGGLLSLGLFFAGRLTAPDKSRRRERSPGKVDRRPALREPERGQEQRLFRRRHPGRNPHPALEDRRDQGHLAHLDPAIQSKPGNLAEIAKQLGVAHILEGSVQKAGESVRVNVQLIKAAGDSHLWAETYDRKLTDIFAVESEVAQRIADSLEAKLTGREKAAINYVGTKVPAAYDAYLRAIALRNSQSRKEQMQLIEYCRQAVDARSRLRRRLGGTDLRRGPALCAGRTDRRPARKGAGGGGKRAPARSEPRRRSCRDGDVSLLLPAGIRQGPGRSFSRPGSRRLTTPLSSRRSAWSNGGRASWTRRSSTSSRPPSSIRATGHLE